MGGDYLGWEKYTMGSRWVDGRARVWRWGGSTSDGGGLPRMGEIHDRERLGSATWSYVLEFGSLGPANVTLSR